MLVGISNDLEHLFIFLTNWKNSILTTLKINIAVREIYTSTLLRGSLKIQLVTIISKCVNKYQIKGYYASTL